VTTEEHEGAKPGEVAPAAAGDAALVAALRAGDEATFATLVETYHATLVRLARLYVPSHGVAEEVVQETWIGVLDGIDRFEGRASLKTWLFRILTNRAKRRGQQEARSLPFSALAASEVQRPEPAVDPARFRGPADRWPGGWLTHPPSWAGEPERRLLAGETRRVIEDSIARLPEGQRSVIALRDIEGWEAADVCTALAISETNQRVLLHRARAKVRLAFERYLEQE
jgi:RNA polymerase sigma-70 factor (ECF subfamily)